MPEHRRRRSRKGSWLNRIPRHAWILVEVLVTVLIVHYVRIPVSDLLPLLKLFMQLT